jgi:hypothetical protein
MSGLFKSISNAVSSVVNTVVDTVTNTVKAAISDPIGTIAKVAAVATGNAWALPLISGADTIAHGGSVTDALKSAGTAYVATGIAGQVSSGLDSAMGTGAAKLGLSQQNVGQKVGGSLSIQSANNAGIAITAIDGALNQVDLNRDSHVVSVVRRDLLARGRVLVAYGRDHFPRQLPVYEAVFGTCSAPVARCFAGPVAPVSQCTNR